MTWSLMIDVSHRIFEVVIITLFVHFVEITLFYTIFYCAFYKGILTGLCYIYTLYKMVQIRFIFSY